MGIAFEDAVQHLAKKRGLTRGEAVSLLEKAKDAGDPEVEKVNDLDMHLQIEHDIISRYAGAKQEFYRGVLTPVATIADIARTAITGKGKGEWPLVEELRQRTGKYAPSGLSIPEVVPLFGGTSIPEAAGSAIPFGAVEKAVAPVVETGVQALGGVAPYLERVGGKLGVMTQTDVPANLARVERMGRIAAPTAAAGAVGALYDPQHPLKSAAIGMGLGAVGGMFELAMSRRLADPKIARNPDVLRGYEAIARAQHTSVDEVKSQFQTVADLNAKLATIPGQRALDPISFLDSSDYGNLAGIQGPPVPREGPDVAVKGPIGGSEPEIVRAPRKEYLPKATGRPVVRPRAAVTRQEADLAYAQGIAARRLPWEPLEEGPAKPPPKDITKVDTKQPTLEEVVATAPLAPEAPQPFEEAPPTELPPQPAELRLSEGVEVVRKKKLAKDAADLQSTRQKAKDAAREAFGPKSVEQDPAIAKSQERFAAREAARKAREAEEEIAAFSPRAAAREFVRKAAKPLKGEKGALFPGEKLKPRYMDPREFLLTADVEKGALDDPAVNSMVLEGKKTVGWFSNIRSPGGVFWSNPVTRAMYNRILSYRTRNLLQIGPQMERRFARFASGEGDGTFHKLAGRAMTEEDLNKTSLYAHTMKVDSNGKLVQTDPTATDAVYNEAARWVHTHVMHKLYRIITGTDPHVSEVMKAAGLPYERAQLERLQLIQKSPQGILPPNMKPSTPVEQFVARQLEGSLRFDKSHDLGVLPYNEAGMTMLPVQRERAQLANEIRQLQENIDLYKDTNPAKAQSFVDEMKLREERLKALEEEIAKREAGGKMMGQVVPIHQHYAPLTMAKDPSAAGMLLENNIQSVVNRSIWNGLSKRYFDQMYWDARTNFESIGDARMKRYLVDYIDAQRGVKGFGEDEWVRTVANTLSKRGVSEAQVRSAINSVMKVVAFTRLFMGYRFPLANSMQTLITTLGTAGPEAYGRALMRAMPGLSKDWTKVWAEARAAGVLGEAGNRFRMEAEALGPRRFDKMIDFMSNVPGSPGWAGQMTEEFNRVLSYEAGKIAYDRGTITSVRARLLKTLDPRVMEGGLSPRAARREVGRAMVDTTQFILGKEGRPNAFVGGAIRRGATQFKSFTVGYWSLYGNMAENAFKHGDWAPFLATNAALWTLGGLKAFPLYDNVRNMAIKELGWAPPENSGLYSLSSMIGLGDVANNINITTSVEPFNLPQGTDPTSLLQFAGGPTFGSALNVLDQARQAGYDITSPAAKRAALRAVAPPLLAWGDAISERNAGGLYDTKGRKIVDVKDAEYATRLLGLNVNPRAKYYDWRSKIQAALEGGRPAMAATMRAQAAAEGVYISDAAMSQLKGQIKTQKTKSEGGMFR